MSVDNWKSARWRITPCTPEHADVNVRQIIRDATRKDRNIFEVLSVKEKKASI